jgi:serine/threonine protein kinase
MKKKERLLLINKVCDEFENQLKAGKSAAINEALESARANCSEPEFIDSLLNELIALQMFYSSDRKALAQSLREQYPDRGSLVAEALNQPSLLGTLPAAKDQTKFDPHRLSGNTSPAADLQIDSIGGRFKDLRHHASGGLGDVYIGYDKAVRRKVAVKLLKPGFVANAEAKNRFLNEGAITGALEHPGIVPIYDSGITKDGQPYYAMRLLEGQTLKDAIQELHSNTDAANFEQRQRELIRSLTDVCEAISYAHDQRVIHRDLKPANILLGDYGETVVVDWGLARNERVAAEPLATSDDSGSAVEQQTKLGHVLGTPEYMSPEQAAGDPAEIGRPSDVYALGAVLYCILTGSAPHQTETGLTHQRIEQARQAKHPTARERNDSVPLSLDAICTRAMQVDPESRYATPGELASELNNWLSDLPVEARPDTKLESAARFLRKHRRWSAAAVLALLCVSIGSTFAASVINGQRNELATRKAEAEELAETATSSAREASQANEENVAYVNFMNSFFEQLMPDEGGREMKLADALDQLSEMSAAHPSLSDETRRQILANVVTGFRAIRNDAKSLETARKYADMTVEMHGPTGSDAIGAKASLVLALNQAGEFSECIEVADETLAFLRETGLATEHGKKFDKLVRCRINSLTHLDRHREAVSAWEELCPWLTSLDPTNLPTSLDELYVASKYIESLRAAGDGASALDWQKKIYEAQKKKFGPKHTTVLGSLFRLSRAVMKVEGRESSIPYEQELVNLAKEVLGPEHANTIVARSNLASSLFFLGNYEESKNRFSILRDTLIRKGTSHNDLLSVEAKLARCYLHLGDEEQALELLTAVMEQTRANKDIDPAGMAATSRSFSLAKAQIENGRLQEAIETIQRDIQMYMEAVKEDEASLPDLRRLLQMAFILQGDFDSALALRKFFPKEVTWEWMMEKAQTAEVLLSLGRIDEAKAMMEAILQLPPSKSDGDLPYQVASRKCAQANTKGLLASAILKSDPDRAEQLLREAVAELSKGHNISMQNTYIKIPLERHRKLLEQLGGNRGQ